MDKEADTGYCNACHISRGCVSSPVTHTNQGENRLAWLQQEYDDHDDDNQVVVADVRCFDEEGDGDDQSQGVNRRHGDEGDSAANHGDQGEESLILHANNSITGPRHECRKKYYRRSSDVELSLEPEDVQAFIGKMR